jgi:hypothetical protein
MTTNYEPLLAKTDAAFRLATEDTLRDAQAEAARHSRTGEHAASLAVTSPAGSTDQMSVSLGSPLPQARALERGADVGPRRGPHMKGIHAVSAAAERFPEHMTRRMQEQAR